MDTDTPWNMIDKKTANEFLVRLGTRIRSERNLSNVIPPELSGCQILQRRDYSQTSIFSYFYSIVERVDIIARDLDVSAKRKS